MREFLAETLGFDDLVPHEGAVCLLAGNRVPIVVIPPSEEKLTRLRIDLRLVVSQSRVRTGSMLEGLSGHAPHPP